MTHKIPPYDEHSRTGVQRRKPAALAWKIVLVLALVLSFFQAVTPSPVDIAVSNGDKLLHAFAFLILTLLAWLAFPGRGRAVVIIVSLLAYALLIEFVQLFLTWRCAEFSDFFADCAGIAVGVLLFMPVVGVRRGRHRHDSPM